MLIEMRKKILPRLCVAYFCEAPPCKRKTTLENDIRSDFKNMKDFDSLISENGSIAAGRVNGQMLTFINISKF